MSTDTILMYAIGVFALMAIGMIMTMVEFNRLRDSAASSEGEKSGNDDGDNRQAKLAKAKATVRIIHSNDNAA